MLEALVSSMYRGRKERRKEGRKGRRRTDRNFFFASFLSLDPLSASKSIKLIAKSFTCFLQKKVLYCNILLCFSLLGYVNT